MQWFRSPNLAKMAKMAKNTGPGKMPNFPVRRHGRTQFEALSGILRVAACLSSECRYSE
jgi:hypothetical protein